MAVLVCNQVRQAAVAGQVQLVVQMPQVGQD
jgi:hypothetical protein